MSGEASARSPIEALVSLALDLRWTWLRSADELWRRIDAPLWARTGNPWRVVTAAGDDRLRALLEDAGFRTLLDGVVMEREALDVRPRWFGAVPDHAALGRVAYFCMEFGLTAVLPIYAGGLGVLAGDHLKAACELGVPLVAVGLLYSRGYFGQRFERGAQREEYPTIQAATLPIERVVDTNGAPVGVSLPLPGRSVVLRAGLVRIGAVTLYLLDADDPANGPDDRGITGELYGGDADMRLRQELALGVGGWRLLRGLGLNPDICHLNEGHAALATIERAAEVCVERNWPFERALAATRAGNVFTTHTAVSAGFDRFDRALMEPYLSAYAAGGRVDPDTIWRLGAEPGGGPFNMAHLALHASGRVNGVSRLHGEVSRNLFGRLFGGWPTGDVPVTHVTNGVHVPTWESLEAARLHEDGVAAAGDDGLWSMRVAGRLRLVESVRDRAQVSFRPDALTLGWARRFASYKRPTLLLQDADRFVRLLSHPQRPVQIVVAGKAHPRDEDGKALLREWLAFAERPDVAGRVAVLADYDMNLAATIVQGVDAWHKTPRRPWEASGTSGMKVACNGGLNLSEPDGWWFEAFSSDVGWAFSAVGDERESDALYSLLESDVVPAFYARDDRGLPAAWLARVRASMTRLVPQFSAGRMVREYVERLYLPAAEDYRERSAQDGAVAAEIVAWSRALDECWAATWFKHVEIERVADGIDVEAVLHLALDPAFVAVELVARSPEGEVPERYSLGAGVAVDADSNTFVYRRHVDADGSAERFAVRVVPFHPHAHVPLEQANVLWEPRAVAE